MHYLHDIDPVAIHLGPLAIHWYGLTYLIAFGLAYWLGMRRLHLGRLQINEQAFSDLMFYGMVGVVAGGRIGYMLFYGYAKLAADPLSFFRVWEGGMSFHGGLLGVMLAVWWWSRRHQLALFDTLDFVAPLIPTGLLSVRLGNFVGGELWGRTTDVPWAMIFPNALPQSYPVEVLREMQATGALEGLARHPTQLYEAALEGVVMFLLLWWFSRRPRPRYAVSGMFALLYGVFRFAVEFLREPDAHIGFIAFDWLTMGMLLSMPLILVGLVLLFASHRAPTLPLARRTEVSP
ncbi:MAG: Prolipoprotein diacylglyceryl transferase [Alphaproteobacteria bacterium ADurb.BinA280]|jgi:phosphatidylglycerol:prolipoprotein diacylglycerol transferase|nr:prolipoprotein diacylglyceryl transferase [Aquimonas sp.]OPZ11985.1 MAG: Prolipoprotein diacylglyceryl transferase [Alphaproteobacteria bacterium ADurb.BinA280]